MNGEDKDGAGTMSSMNIADDGLPYSIFGPPPAETKAKFPDQPGSHIQASSTPASDIAQCPSKQHITNSDTCVNPSSRCDRPFAMEQEPNNAHKHTSLSVPPTTEKHVSNGIPEEEDQLSADQTMEGDGMRKGYPGDERLVAQKRTYAVYRDELGPSHQDEAQSWSHQTAQSETGGIKQPPAKKKGIKPKYLCGKDAREQAVTRQRKKHDALKLHIRKLMQKQGTDIEIADVPAPRPTRRRMIKIQASDDSDDSDSSIDPDASEPEAQMVSAKDNVKEIDGLIVGGGGLTNRRTGSQKTDLKYAKTTFGKGKVQTWKQGDEKRFQLQGMTAKLKPFQLVGTSWMVKRETDDGDHKGGLLADVPGFGKTVMSLGAIVGNPPSPEQIDQGIRATLIVVPNISILKQWEAEIEKHLEHANAKYLHYKSAMKDLEPDVFINTNIVLTTYQELQRGWPSGRKRDDLVDECTITTISDDGEEEYAVDGEKYHHLCRERADVLFRVTWYRVIFDEVHTVKNINSETCTAARELRYTIFWGLSGTPLINAAKELFPYLRLIRWDDVQTWDQYRERYLKSTNGRQRVDALVNLLTYRRTHNDHFFGKKMVKLPKNHAGTQWVTLTDEERVVYDLTTKFFENANAPNGAQLKLRQRQAVSHFYLLEAFFRSINSTAVFKNYVEKLAEVENKRAAREQIGSWTERQFAGQKPLKCDEETVFSQPMGFGKSNFGGKFQLTPLLEIFVNTQMLVENGCSLCRRGNGQFDDPRQIPECGHIFCNECLLRRWLQNSSNRGKMLCPECRAEFTDDPFCVPQLDTIYRSQPQQIPNGAVQQPKRRKKNALKFGEAPDRRPGDDFFGVQPSFGDENGGLWGKVVLDDMFRNGGIPTPSAKTTAVKDIVLQWIAEDDSHKGIIFTQFVTTALVIGRMLQLEGIPFLYLNGKVTSAEKLKAISGFKDKNSKIRYLVASMKCGGQSLDLTCASRTIICDTWWNKAAEEQAFGRVFRIGQKKTTHNVRILARDTVDEDIDQMQDDKETEIKHTLQDDGHETQVFSEFEITKILQPEKWLEWVQQCVDEIREEDGIAPDSMDVDNVSDQEPEAEMDSAGTEQSMTKVFKDMRDEKVGHGKAEIIDLDGDSDGEWRPGQ